MAKIKGPGETDPTKAAQPASADDVERAADVAYVGQANALRALLQSDDLVRFFAAAGERLASGELKSREDAVHAAVDAVLAEALPMFTPPMRAKLVPEVSEALLAEPTMAANFDLLLGIKS